MMTSTLPHKEPEFMTEINITPFTDVLLVLLIIFMILAALATPPGFQKRFPGPPGFADANARYDWIIKVLDAARQAGDEDVGFVAP